MLDATYLNCCNCGEFVGVVYNDTPPAMDLYCPWCVMNNAVIYDALTYGTDLCNSRVNEFNGVLSRNPKHVDQVEQRSSVHGWQSEATKLYNKRYLAKLYGITDEIKEG